MLDVFDAAQKASFKIIDWGMEYFPVGVFALTTVNFAVYGMELFGPYVRIAGCVMIGVLLMIFLIYPMFLLLLCRENPYRVLNKIKEVTDATLNKLSDMNPQIANSLSPSLPSVESLKWADVFKNISITGDDDIAINKRGSGVKRLILLNFFRAKAERIMVSVQYSPMLSEKLTLPLCLEFKTKHYGKERQDRLRSCL